MAGTPHDYETKQAYVNWKLTPPAHRVPKTQIAWCEENGVGRTTVWFWEKEDWYIDEMRKAKSSLGAKWYGDILGRLMSIVEEGADRDANTAAKTLLQHLDFSDQETKDKGSFSKEDLETILEGAGVKIVKE